MFAMRGTESGRIEGPTEQTYNDRGSSFVSVGFPVLIALLIFSFSSVFSVAEEKMAPSFPVKKGTNGAGIETDSRSDVLQNRTESTSDGLNRAENGKQPITSRSVSDYLSRFTNSGQPGDWGRTAVPGDFHLERGITFWVLDANGEWRIPLPNWTVEDIMRSLELQNEETDHHSYSIQSINVNGKVEGSLARLTVEYRIYTDGSPKVRVPLGLKEGVWLAGNGSKDLYDMIKYSGQGDYYIEYDSSQNGYVAVIENKKGKAEGKPDPTLEKGRETFTRTDRSLERHILSLSLCFQVEESGGDEYRLKVSFPPAVHGKVRLAVPLSDLTLSVSQGVMAMPPVTLSEKSSELTLNGLNRTGGPMELTWRKKESLPYESEVVYQVEDAEIEVTPSFQDIQFAATLPVRLDGGASELFQIRLPKRAHLLRESVTASDFNNRSLEIRSVVENRSLVEIRLARAVSDQITLRLRASISDPPKDSSELMAHDSSGWELGGFELIGAQKQYGRVKFAFPKDLSFKITPISGVRIRPMNGESENGDQEEYNFYSQPFSLQAQVLDRQTRIKVEPEYQILVQEGEVRLKVRYRFMVFGSKIRRLSLKIHDWFISEVRSNYLVDITNIQEDEKKKELLLPLTVATDGAIEIELLAVRQITDPSKPLVFPLPIPVADWIEPASVVVLPDDNVELVPLPQKMLGLRLRSLSTLAVSYELPSRQQQPLSFVMESRDNRKTEHAKNEETLPLFAANVKYNRRTIEVESHTDVHLVERESDQIQQTLTYMIKYEPLESILLSVPTDLPETAEMKIIVDGKPVPPQNIVNELNDETNPRMMRKRILLPDSRCIGTCVVTIQYSSREFELLPQMTNKISVDLIQPLDGNLVSNQVNVITPSGIGIELNEVDSTDWSFDSSRSVTKGENLSWRFSTTTPQNRLVLKGVVSARDVFGTTIVERAWLQTWLIHSTRLDRIAYRIVSDQETVTLVLPPQVRRDRITMLFNNVLTSIVSETENTVDRSKVGTINSRGELVVPIPEEYRMKSFTLDLSWMLQLSMNNEPKLIDFPVFADSSVWVRRAYWQVILPSTRHLIGAMPRWTPEYFNDIVWAGAYWKREASMTQEDLAIWVGVDQRERIPNGTNVYLFSSFDAPPMSQPKIVDRSVLILLGSGMTLFFGFCFIYIPFVRRRAFLLLLTVLFVGVCLWQPATSLIFLQTTVLGILLTVLTLFLTRIFGSDKKDWTANRQERALFAGSLGANYPGSSFVGHSSLWKEPAAGNKDPS